MDDKMFRRHTIEIFRSAWNAVVPQTIMHNTILFHGETLSFSNGLKVHVNKNAHVIGFGKASLQMACAMHTILGQHIQGGVLSVPVGSQETFKKSEILNENSKILVLEGAANNLPDENSMKAGKTIEEYIRKLDKNDLLLTLISGGGSALLPSPIPPITLEEKRQTTQLLASHGATIHELNIVRKNLSILKGGGLAKLAFPAQVISLILSDVIGDPLDLIASGPTVPNCSTRHDALEILQKFNIISEVPQSILKVLSSPDSATPSNKIPFSHVTNILIGSNSSATVAAQITSERLGYSSITLTNSLDGEAKLVGELLAILATSIGKFLSSDDVTHWQKDVIHHPMAGKLLPSNKLEELDRLLLEAKANETPICILTGGETTVTLTSTSTSTATSGIGGRNQELILTCAMHLDRLNTQNSSGQFDVSILSAGTDGLDGPTTAAGAMTYPSQILQSRHQGLDAQVCLSIHDSNSFFTQLNDGRDLVITGHTGTNVMDIQIVIVGKVMKKKL